MSPIGETGYCSYFGRPDFQQVKYTTPPPCTAHFLPQSPVPSPQIEAALATNSTAALMGKGMVDGGVAIHLEVLAQRSPDQPLRLPPLHTQVILRSNIPTPPAKKRAPKHLSI